MITVIAFFQDQEVAFGQGGSFAFAALEASEQVPEMFPETEVTLEGINEHGVKVVMPLELFRSLNVAYRDMLNLTPHPITIDRGPAGRITLPASGTVARVATTETVVGTCPITGVPIVERKLGEPVGLPPTGVPCIVSAMVAGAVPGREGVFAPDTGPTALRDERGQVVAVTRLVRA